MPCITCLGKEAKVRESDPPNHLSLFFDQPRSGFFFIGGMDEDEGKEDQIDGEVYEEEVRLPQRLHRFNLANNGKLIKAFDNFVGDLLESQD